MCLPPPLVHIHKLRSRLRARPPRDRNALRVCVCVCVLITLLTLLTKSRSPCSPHITTSPYIIYIYTHTYVYHARVFYLRSRSLARSLSRAHALSLTRPFTAPPRPPGSFSQNPESFYRETAKSFRFRNIAKTISDINNPI